MFRQIKKQNLDYRSPPNQFVFIIKNELCDWTRFRPGWLNDRWLSFPFKGFLLCVQSTNYFEIHLHTYVYIPKVPQLVPAGHTLLPVSLTVIVPIIGGTGGVDHLWEIKLSSYSSLPPSNYLRLQWYSEWSFKALIAVGLSTYFKLHVTLSFTHTHTRTHARAGRIYELGNRRSGGFLYYRKLLNLLFACMERC